MPSHNHNGDNDDTYKENKLTGRLVLLLEGEVAEVVGNARTLAREHVPDLVLDHIWHPISLLPQHTLFLYKYIYTHNAHFCTHLILHSVPYTNMYTTERHARGCHTERTAEQVDRAGQPAAAQSITANGYRLILGGDGERAHSTSRFAIVCGYHTYAPIIHKCASERGGLNFAEALFTNCAHALPLRIYMYIIYRLFTRIWSRAECAESISNFVVTWQSTRQPECCFCRAGHCIQYVGKYIKVDDKRCRGVSFDYVMGKGSLLSTYIVLPCTWVGMYTRYRFAIYGRS